MAPKYIVQIKFFSLGTDSFWQTSLKEAQLKDFMHLAQDISTQDRCDSSGLHSKYI